MVGRISWQSYVTANLEIKPLAGYCAEELLWFVCFIQNSRFILFWSRRNIDTWYNPYLVFLNFKFFLLHVLFCWSQFNNLSVDFLQWRVSKETLKYGVDCNCVILVCPQLFCTRCSIKWFCVCVCVCVESIIWLELAAWLTCKYSVWLISMLKR